MEALLAAVRESEKDDTFHILLLLLLFNNSAVFYFVVFSSVCLCHAVFCCSLARCMEFNTGTKMHTHTHTLNQPTRVNDMHTQSSAIYNEEAERGNK